MVYVSISDNSVLEIKVQDNGRGIEDINKAFTPFFTTNSDYHAGIGFTVMQCFMDNVTVQSAPGKGTTVMLRKKFGAK